jgi:oligopeptide/dipeptide ABC transporter ATP-binding protein
VADREKLVSIEGLRVNLATAGGVVHAVRGVDLDIRRNEIIGLVGETGCGKSITAKSVMRLNNEDALLYRGGIIFGGRNLLELPEREMQDIRGKEISMIFQDPFAALDPLLRVGDQIAEMFLLRGFSRGEAAERSLQLLADVGIHPMRERSRSYPFEMSGGQLQRVMIAIALACEPKLLIADEPTTALDVTVQAQILELLMKLQAKSGMSVLVITHNFGIVAEICARVAVMYAGRIVEVAETAEVFRGAKHPYTADLIASIPKSGRDRPVSIPGMPPDLRELTEGCPYAPRCAFADDVCFRVLPEMREPAPGHRFACHRV